MLHLWLVLWPQIYVIPLHVSAIKNGKPAVALTADVASFIQYAYKLNVINMLPNEMIQAYLVNVLCRGEKNRWFCEVTHGVELRPFCCWMVQLIHLFASCSRHLALSSPSLLITCLSLSTLKKEAWIVRVSFPWLCSYFLTELLLLWKWSLQSTACRGKNVGPIKVVISRPMWSLSAVLHIDCKSLWKILLHLEACKLQKLRTGW